MTYGFVHDVPANEEMYREIRARIGDRRPDGLVAHIVMRRDEGLRYVDVWETQADWERFHDERVDPAVSAVLASYGLAHDPSIATFTEFDVVDAWIGSPVSV